MSFRILSVLLMMGLSQVQCTSAQETSQVAVGEIKLERLAWGEQKASFEVINNTDYLKFITVTTDIVFEGVYLQPARKKTSYFILGPEQTRLVEPVFDIPANFGRARMDLTVYDVVDTLDQLLPTQKIAEQTFKVNIKIPDKMTPYLQNKISLPPMVGKSPSFDSEFSRILILLLNEGRSVLEIAAMADTDTGTVIAIIKKMEKDNYISRRDSTITFNFPVISIPEAEEVKKLAEDVSDKLALMVKNNLPAYRKVLDSLVQARVLTTDTNYFLHGGVVLHREYPVVAALFLWYDLAQEFIDKLTPLEIYAGTDPCHAHIPKYMYVVEGGDFFNGTNFYNLLINRNQLVVTYGDTLPIIECAEGYENLRRLSENQGWWYSPEMIPETFMIDTALVHVSLRGLRTGSAELIKDTQAKLQKIVSGYGQEQFVASTRLWFWNLATTRALKKMVDAGTLIRRGNGLYRFEKVRAGI
ncbi:MAG: winged helix-turn-helix domain-containing protein [Candidatus Zixiibacteriota bacterium]